MANPAENSRTVPAPLAAMALFWRRPMFIGQDVPLDQQVPLQEVQQAVEQMARDANGTNKTLLQLVAGKPANRMRQKGSRPWKRS